MKGIIMNPGYKELLSVTALPVAKAVAVCSVIRIGGGYAAKKALKPHFGG